MTFLKQFAFITTLLIGIFATYLSMATTINEDGLHVQPWFTDSFLFLKEDVADAAADGKRVAVLFEQRACPCCKEMHNVNLADPGISEFIKNNFSIIQMSLWGAREVVDLDGKTLEERALALRWRVNFTPTIVFLPTPEEVAKGEVEVARMPGYFKPFHFLSMFEFVDAGAYVDQNFQHFLQNKFKLMEEKGVKPKVW